MKENMAMSARETITKIVAARASFSFIHFAKTML